MSINGHTWAMTEEANPEEVEWRRQVGSGGEKCNPPLVVTQHMESNRRLVLLTTMVSMREKKVLTGILVFQTRLPKAWLTRYCKSLRPQTKSQLLGLSHR